MIALGFITAAAAQQPNTNISFQRDIIYGRAGAEDLKLDLAQPAAGTTPFPALVPHHLVIVEGGGHGWVGEKLDRSLA